LNLLKLLKELNSPEEWHRVLLRPDRPDGLPISTVEDGLKPHQMGGLTRGSIARNAFHNHNVMKNQLKIKIDAHTFSPERRIGE
jgi:hypothetical protein